MFEKEQSTTGYVHMEKAPCIATNTEQKFKVH